MAITTKDERLACINGVGHLFLPPDADGNISQNDRWNFVFLHYHDTDITLQDIYDLLEECCENLTYWVQNIYAVVAGQNKRIIAIEEAVKTCNYEKLYSAIRDMRRELLRGNKPGRTDLRR